MTFTLRSAMGSSIVAMSLVVTGCTAPPAATRPAAIASPSSTPTPYLISREAAYAVMASIEVPPGSLGHDPAGPADGPDAVEQVRVLCSDVIRARSGWTNAAGSPRSVADYLESHLPSNFILLPLAGPMSYPAGYLRLTYRIPAEHGAEIVFTIVAVQGPSRPGVQIGAQVIQPRVDPRC